MREKKINEEEKEDKNEEKKEKEEEKKTKSELAREKKKEVVPCSGKSTEKTKKNASIINHTNHTQ